MSECADQRAAGADGVARGMAYVAGNGWGKEQSNTGRGFIGVGEREVIRCSGVRSIGGLAVANQQGSSRRGIRGPGEGSGTCEGAALERLEGLCEDRTTAAPMLGRNPADWLYCRDGKWRAVEPGTFPLVDAAPARVGRLRAYGNALDAETATQFCEVVREICDDLRPVTEFDL